MATLAFDVCGSTFVGVTAEAPLTDEEWDAACRRMAKRDFTSKLVWSAGGAPDAAQRLKIREVLQDETERVALVTQSLDARAVLGIMSVFFRNMRAFDPKDLEGALEYLKIPAADRPGVLQLLERLRGEVGLVEEV